MSVIPNKTYTCTGLSNNQLKYTILLDDTDIGLLPIHFKKEELNTSIPLWSCKSKRFDSYHEFELIAELTDDDENEDVVDEANSNKYTCHICNTTVPQMFTKVHNSSTRHKTCLAIAEQALERIKKNLSPVDAQSMKENSTLHYCDPCSTALDFKHRDEHEKSQEHLLSVLHEQLHQSFLKMYSDRNNNEVNFIADITNLINKHSKPKDHIEWLEHQSLNDYTECERSWFDGEAPQLDLKSYLRLLELNTSARSYTLTAVDNDHISITINDSRVVVSIDNFHSFYVLESLNRCRLCDVIVYHKEAHILMPMHMKRVCSPILDKHCIRLLNAPRDHCIICNVSIEYIDGFVHAYCDDRHKTLLEHALEPTVIEINNNNSEEANSNSETKTRNEGLLVANYRNAQSKVIVTSKDGGDYCTACEVEVPAGKNSHQCSLDHRQKLWQRGYRSILHHHVKRSRVTSGEVQCKICNMKLKYCTDEINEHIGSELHDSKYKSLLEFNQIRKQDEHRSICGACGTTLLYMDELDHIECKKHLKKLKKSKKLSKKNTDTLNNGSDDETELQNNAELPTEVEQTLKRHYLIEDRNHQVKCKVCDIDIENNVEYITTHLEHPEHVDSYNYLLTKNAVKLCQKDLLYKFYCDICEVYIMAENEMDHISGDTHCEKKSLNYELKVKENRTNDTEACDCHEKPTLDSQANVGIKSVENTLSSEYYTCDICKIKVPNRESSIKIHFEGATHRINLDQKFTSKSKASLHYLIEVAGDKVTCKICNVKIPNVSNIQQHIKGRSHCSKYNSMLSRNGMKFINSYNKYYCDICFVSIAETKEYDHMSSANHSISLKYKFQVDD